MLGAHGILGWIIIGGLAGAIAKALMPGRDPGGCIITIILGIAGAVVAGYLGQALHIYRPGEAVGFIAAIIGAFIILFIYRLIAGRRRL
ncbi:MAG: GlsB/YeaQ/YmgE family stress response membrane protein [Sphingomicrobium sp.]|nr:GlsB/YeaQ/YmgE family stress response membrane protein [Sphingomonadales bacterium]